MYFPSASRPRRPRTRCRSFFKDLKFVPIKMCILGSWVPSTLGLVEMYFP